MSERFDQLTKGLARSVTGRAALKLSGIGLAGVAFASFGLAPTAHGADAANTSIPWFQIGAKAEVGYKGDGLAVTPTSEGARLRCVFQRVEGEATRAGLWLTSTVTNAVNDRFRVVATAVGRTGAPLVVPGEASELPRRVGFTAPDPAKAGTTNLSLPIAGTVSFAGQMVRFDRPGLIEEYSVSMDGVRQDFVVLKRPEGAGELVVRLAVSGAKIEPAPGSARLVLELSGRKIAYSRLRVTDGTGKDLPARMEVGAMSGATTDPEAPPPALVVVVDDSDAVYPVRIDPTFSDANWISMNPSIPGADSTVYAAVVDGSGNLYIGGNFTVVGDVTANGIAKWDGRRWSALGSGMGAGFYTTVYALAVSGSNVYAGGHFTTAGGTAATSIAKWDGSSWSALGLGITDPYPEVYALALSGSDVYVGGSFTKAGGIRAIGIAKWDGSSWSALGSGLNLFVYALAVSGSDVYAGGRFTTAGGVPANKIAKWDGSSWSALGLGITDPYPAEVYALAVSGSDVYAGGSFTNVDGAFAPGIAKWDGSGWSALGSGIGRTDSYSPSVSALAVSGSNLYVGGSFTTAGGNVANSIAKWDGSSWSALGSGVGGVDPYVRALAMSGSNLYAGGDFTTAGDTAASYIAGWNGRGWSALTVPGSGMNDRVWALAVSGSNLYVGGSFTTAGGNVANSIAKWNGSSWSALGSGMNGGVGRFLPSGVYALAVSGTDLYAGGNFTTADGNVVNSIAKWDGTSWSALGQGVGGPNPYVYALAVSGSNLYAGGWFTTAGGNPAYRIAKWNGSSWRPLGSGMNDNVLALALSGNDLYAGGEFTMAGSVYANYVAKWNGSTWSALGSGVGPGSFGTRVEALAVSGRDLYAGGEFFFLAGSVYANYVAKWNGTSWSALGSGIGADNFVPIVVALTVSGGDLYAGGRFQTAGGSPANSIAKWDGSHWTALGSGAYGPPTHSSVLALAVMGNDLYAGGGFTIAGGKLSGYIARAYLPTLPTLSIFHSGPTITVSWPSADAAGFALEQAEALMAPASWAPNAASITNDGTNKSVTLPATNSAQFFRLRAP
ncbi:MAG TPA: hypothetical protein VNU68_29130 [Verrucomicrobiae bacterium]|nr:hypothetical protein [Verrucomicrobiae bacterium]